MRNLKIFSLFCCGFFLFQLSFFYLLNFLGFDYPYTSYLFDPNDRFNDWINKVYSSRGMNPYRDSSQGVADFFPFFYFLIYPISKLEKLYSIIFFLIISVGFFTHAFFKLVNIACKMFDIPVNPLGSMIFVSLLLLAYPSQFSLDRGNIDLLISAFIAYALSFLISSKFTAFALLIGFLASLKGYPLFYLALLLVRKRYIECILGLLFFIGLEITAILFFDGGVDNLWLFIGSLNKYRDVYIIGNGSFHFFSDFFNFGKFILFYFDRLDLVGSLFVWYSVVVSCLLIFLFFLLFRVANTDLALQFSICSFGAIIYPCLINDYKLTIFYSAIVLLVLQQRLPMYVLILYAALISPKNYYVILADLNTGSVINPIILFFTLLATIRYALKNGNRPLEPKV